MTLTTHAVAGGAVALTLRAHPALGVLAACASHFALDAIPHWDHPIRSRTTDKKDPMNERVSFFTKEFYGDVLATSCDGILGIALTGAVAAAFAPHHMFLALAGACAAILPDALQFVYYIFPSSPIRHLQKLHRWVHAKTDFNNRPWIGIPMQVGIMLVIVSIVGTFRIR